MPNNKALNANRVTSFYWIALAYSLCFLAASVYLYYSPLQQALIDAFIADTIATIIIFMFSRFFRNSSFYDAYWSVLPPFLLGYWWCYHHSDIDTQRFFLVSIVVAFWAIRLTWNWCKHWPGLSHEDWRYDLLKAKVPKIECLTDFFGIHFFPTVQVFLGMLPVYALTVLNTGPLNSLDIIAFIIGVSAPTIQLIADRQLHHFIAHRKPGEIIEVGLWKYSRHPNYFGELLFWLSLGLFGLAAYPEGWWWQGLGFIAMLLMFLLASIPMMEERSLERRPNYQRIIDSTSMLIPMPKKR